MFETEADFAETKMIVQCNGNYAKFKSYKDGFQEGAEFGYNKAIKELETANEWHFVKDGNPKNENDILCQISKDEVVVGYYHIKEKRYITIDGHDLYNVIAWKEIILPKESEK